MRILKAISLSILLIFLILILSAIIVYITIKDFHLGVLQTVVVILIFFVLGTTRSLMGLNMIKTVIDTIQCVALMFIGIIIMIISFIGNVIKEVFKYILGTCVLIGVAIFVFIRIIIRKIVSLFIK